MELEALEAIGTRVEEGAWVQNIPNLPKGAIKSRGRHNSDYSRLHVELSNKLNPDGKEDPAIDEQIETELLVETCVVDWNLTSGGVPVPFTKERLRAMITDPKFKVFRRACIFAANVVATMGTETLEADAKN